MKKNAKKFNFFNKNFDINFLRCCNFCCNKCLVTGDVIDMEYVREIAEKNEIAILIIIEKKLDTNVMKTFFYDFDVDVRASCVKSDLSI